MRKMSQFWGILVLVFFYIGCASNGDKIIPGLTPIKEVISYVQNLNHDQASLAWFTEKEWPSTIEVKKQGKVIFKQVSEKESFHNVRIGRPDIVLEPDTNYTYTIDGILKGTFHTFPKPDFYDVRLIVYGDSRNNPQIHESLAQLMKKEKALLAVHTGDMVDNGYIQNEWMRFYFEPLYKAELINNIPIFPVLGNHELESIFYFLYYDKPNYYSLNVGPVHFVFLDSNAVWEMPEQLRWLKEDLKNDNHPWKIAVLHHPVFSVKESRKGHWQSLIFVPTFYQYGVNFIFTGHDHHYARSKAIFNSQGASLVQIVTGGGGAPLYDIEESSLIEKAEKVHHFVVLDVSPWRIQGKVVDITGEVIDKFTFGKTDELAEDQKISLEEVKSIIQIKQNLKSY